MDLVGPDGQVINVKSRVPQPFLNLMKGGKGPKAEPHWKRKQQEASSANVRHVGNKKSTGKGAFLCEVFR